MGPGKTASRSGWQPLAFALDWQRPARHMNNFYIASTNHSAGGAGNSDRAGTAVADGG